MSDRFEIKIDENLKPDLQLLRYCHAGEALFYFDKDGNFVIPAAQVKKIFMIASVISQYAKSQEGKQ